MELTSSKTLPTFAVTRRNCTGSAEFILRAGVCLFLYYAVMLHDLLTEQYCVDSQPEYNNVEVMYSLSFCSGL